MSAENAAWAVGARRSIVGGTRSAGFAAGRRQDGRRRIADGMRGTGIDYEMA